MPASLTFETQSNGAIEVHTVLDPTDGLANALREVIAGRARQKPNRH